MAGEPKFFLRIFIQLNPFLRRSYKNWRVYVQTYLTSLLRQV